jgi:hypothetical protein
MNRLKPILQDLKGTEDPDDLMIMIMEALKDIEYAPDKTGTMFTFIYLPKTPNILYDQHPLVEVTEITSWGFKGFNYHWNRIRNYTFPEIVGPMHRLYPVELQTLRTIPYRKFLMS